MNDRTYEEDLYIDPNALDVEWMEQPNRFMKYAEAAANARLEVDQAKQKLEITKAEADFDIRRDPAKYDIKKITESVVTNTVLQVDEVVKMNKEYLLTRHNYEVCLAGVKAMEQRKDALENLVRLMGQQYFAGPIAPRDLSKEYNKTKKTTSTNKVKQAMSRKK